MRPTRRALLTSFTSLVIAGISAPAFAASDATPETRALLDAAQATIVDLAADKDFSGFKSSLHDAKAVLVFPKIFAAGLVLGGSGGNGVLMVRNDITGEWNGPIFYTLAGVSAGLEAGAVNGSLVLQLRSEKALDSIYHRSTKLGGNATVALGTKAATAAKAVSSDFVAYSKVKGVFAGVAVNGVVLNVRRSLNDKYYGKKLTPSEMVLAPASATPSADGLRQALRAAAG